MTVTRINWCVTWGAVFAVGGAVMVGMWPPLFHLQVKRMMTLANGSTSFGIWREIPIPMYLECFLFNVTNVDDILAGKHVKLRVQQMGPYVFQETQTKVNIEWNANSTVSYQVRRHWHFVPDRSNGSLSDIVTNINPIIPTIAYALRNQNIMLRAVVDMVTRVYHKQLFLSANVSSWLFDGIEDPILSITSRIPNFPYAVPFDKFGWLYTRNGSSDFDGWFVVNTGADDFSRLGKVEMWNHAAQTVYSGQCGEVRGSTGELWALKHSQPEISVFAPDICTTLTLAASGSITVLGIEGTLFSSNDSFFDNGQKYPSKSCYCDGDSDCMVSGAMNVSACRYGAPAFATLPHFHQLDPYYANKVDGLEPSENHTFQMAIERVTGMPLMVNAQLQVSVLVRHTPGQTINNQLPDPDVLVPMFWFRERVLVDGVYSRFATIALSTYHGMTVAFYVMMIIGVLVLAAGFWLSKDRILRRHSAVQEAQKFISSQSELT